MKKKKYLSKLNLLNKMKGNDLVRVASKIYRDLIYSKYRKYTNPKQEDINKLIEICQKNKWNIVEYLKFQIEHCESKHITSKMVISKRAIELWQNRKKFRRPQLKTNKGIMYDTLRQNEYFLSLLRKKHGNKTWIEKYFGEKAKYNIDVEIIYEGDKE